MCLAIIGTVCIASVDGRLLEGEHRLVPSQDEIAGGAAANASTKMTNGERRRAHARGSGQRNQVLSGLANPIDDPG